jgi:hypothetical protein
MKVMGITGFPPHSVNIFFAVFYQEIVSNRCFIRISCCKVRNPWHLTKYLSFFTHRTARFGPEIWKIGCNTISHSLYCVLCNHWTVEHRLHSSNGILSNFVENTACLATNNNEFFSFYVRYSIQHCFICRPSDEKLQVRLRPHIAFFGYCAGTHKLEIIKGTWQWGRFSEVFA